MLMNNRRSMTNLQTDVSDIIINTDDLQYHRGKRQDLFLLIADDGHTISLVGCDCQDELEDWAYYFNSFGTNSGKKILIKCDVLDQYSLPYEIDAHDRVWVLIEGLSFEGYNNMKEATSAIEDCIDKGETTISDINVLAGKQLFYRDYEEEEQIQEYVKSTE